MHIKPLARPAALAFAALAAAFSTTIALADPMASDGGMAPSAMGQKAKHAKHHAMAAKPMSHSAMAHGAMSTGAMSHDAMSHDAMSSDAMSSSGATSSGAMSSGAMGH
jgi:pentapeptide MXKDX repeat protein